MARACLGRGYKLEGTIVEGHHKGTLLGFPTANLKPECPEQLIPGRGVYAVKAYIEGFSYKAMLNIGWRPTLDNGHDQSIEAHLFDYEGGELYGKQLSIVFTAAYNEQRFESLRGTAAQLTVDADTVQQMLKRNPMKGP